MGAIEEPRESLTLWQEPSALHRTRLRLAGNGTRLRLAGKALGLAGNALGLAGNALDGGRR